MRWEGGGFSAFLVTAMNRLMGIVLFLTAALASAFSAFGQDGGSFVPPDDLSTSLLICQPGRSFYSGFGHCALRLQCPSHGLDVTFTYALDDNLANRIAMFRGRGAGRYSSVRTAAFLEEYVQEGRGVVDYPVNISVEQTRALWQILDGENASPRFRQYNFLHTNCASMCFYALERVMNGRSSESHQARFDGRVVTDGGKAKGEEIVWDGLSEGCTGTYRTFVGYVSRGRPWTGLFWNSILGATGEETGRLEDKLAPMLVEPVIAKATIRRSDGGEARPFLKGEPVCLVEQTLTYPRNPFTPTVVFALLLAVAVFVSLYERLRGYNVVLRTFDILLLVMQTLAGLFIFYLSCLSHMVGAAHNWNIIVFNPLPLLLWICFRRRRWFPRVYLFYAAVLLLYIASWTFRPNVTLPHVLLALTFLVRTSMRIGDIRKARGSHKTKEKTKKYD